MRGPTRRRHVVPMLVLAGLLAVAVAGTYAPALVVAGGFALRWVVVSAGQATGLV